MAHQMMGLEVCKIFENHLVIFFFKTGTFRTDLTNFWPPSRYVYSILINYKLTKIGNLPRSCLGVQTFLQEILFLFKI